ncbi:hypothetical protein JW926_17410 [Candidatus Sumerlaeota bacterium]|nr:hypothetical protein [Candidatus Sumerlaeota bacterium]
MKRILLIAGLIFCLGGFSLAIDWSANLLLNHDFEDYPDGVPSPTDWRFFAVGGAVGTCTRVTDAFSGIYAAHITWDNPWAGGMDSALDNIDNKYSVTPGVTYVAGGYFKSSNSSVFRIKTPTFTGSGTWLGSDHTDGSAYWKTGTADFQFHTVEFTAEPTAAQGQATFQLVTTGGGILTIDKVFVMTKASYDYVETAASPSWTLYE